MFRKCDKTNNTKQRVGQCTRQQVSGARDDGLKMTLKKETAFEISWK